MKFYGFPDGFEWGGAVSALQAEGQPEGRLEVSYDRLHQMHPERFYDGVGPHTTSDLMNNFKKDVQLMRSLGMNSTRTSIAWSRLMLNERDVNPEAVKYYNDYFDELLKNNIQPMVCLFHIDMPMMMEDKGGWESREVVEHFVHFAKQCFSIFGHKIKRWLVHNEPTVTVWAKYLGQYDYPCVKDEKRAIQAGFNIAYSHARVIEAYRQMDLDGKIGIVSNLLPGIPADSSNPEDVSATNFYDAWHNYAFIDAAVLGKFPEYLVQLVKEEGGLPTYEEADLDVIARNTVDFIGINYYYPVRTKAIVDGVPHPDCGKLYPFNVYSEYRDPNAVYNESRGWEVYPKALFDVAEVIKERYNNIEWFVSENGMGVENEEKYLDINGKVMDDYRIDFFREHLMWLNKAIANGANCMGYHCWSWIDNWSPINAYKNRYGLVRVDRNNNFVRSIKHSGDWFREVTIKNGFYWYK
ncbi:TPA: glycoside hydrolase family 1 protein [Vibrio parahaemolyticus]